MCVHPLLVFLLFNADSSTEYPSFLVLIVLDH